MNQYEIAVLFDPQLEVDLSKATNKIEKLIKDNKGKIVDTDNWGKKKLAYPIAKQENAIYVFYTVELPAESLQKIESILNITDEVLRYLITRVDHKAIAKADEARKEKAAKAKARGDSPNQSDEENNDNETEK